MATSDQITPSEHVDLLTANSIAKHLLADQGKPVNPEVRGYICKLLDRWAAKSEFDEHVRHAMQDERRSRAYYDTTGAIPGYMAGLFVGLTLSLVLHYMGN